MRGDFSFREQKDGRGYEGWQEKEGKKKALT